MALQDDELTDDYVASLLKRDAERSSNRSKYSDLHTGTTRPGNRATPNTRFFRHIIRETDSHNAALKRKEEEEARARRAGAKRVREEESGPWRGEKRRRSRDRDEHDESRGRRGHDRERHGRLKSRSRSRSRERRREADAHRKSRRTRESSYDRERKEDHDRRKRRQSRSRERKRTRSPRASSRDTKHVPRDRGSPPRDRGMPHAQDHDVDEEDLIGPRPPPRGRGAHSSGMESIDARFEPGYNPKLDVALDDPAEDDDWASSLEALRARTQWRHNGAERLQAAGFSEEQIRTWKSGSSTREKDPEQVRWTKKGESREWDRGKFLDGDHVDLRAAWTRGGTL